MLWLFVMMVAGLLAGRCFRGKVGEAAAGRVVTVCVWLLLFLLGFGVGGDAYTMNRLGTLGVEALVLTLGGVLGSVSAACLFERLLRRRRKGGRA